jgi:hypothetical protein
MKKLIYFSSLVLLIAIVWIYSKYGYIGHVVGLIEPNSQILIVQEITQEELQQGEKYKYIPRENHKPVFIKVRNLKNYSYGDKIIVFTTGYTLLSFPPQMFSVIDFKLPF